VNEARFFAPLALGLFAMSACAGAHGSDGGTGGSSISSAQCRLDACQVTDDAGEGPTVSFRQDLQAAIQENCADAPCHGKDPGAQADLYLGPTIPAAVDTSSVLDRVVGVPSRTDPALLLVAPGRPDESFLLLKVEGCQNALGLSCMAQMGSHSGQPCGDTMPQGERPLCNDERRLLRRWIQQGAADN